MSQNEEIQVSIICLVYNHQKYLRQCLDGIISQKTSFRYEVVIHDDASTDESAAIIKEYCKKYPNIIKPIIQTANQHSKGVRIISNIILPVLIGKYVAICEGDDYWCDNNKLQKQYDFLETHPDYISCVHNTEILNCLTGQRYPKIKEAVDETLTTEQLLKNDVREFHTSSVFTKREQFAPPVELGVPFSGDLARDLYYALSGKVYRFADIMSVYRFFAEGSYTSTTSKMEKNQILEILRAKIDMYARFDEYSAYQYHDIFAEKIANTDFDCLLLNNEHKKAIKKYPDLINQKSVKEKARLYLDAYLPCISHLYRWVRNGRKN